MNYSQLTISEILKEIDGHSLMERCPKSLRCSASLCPLDPDMDKRIYLEGDPICRLPFEELMIILNRRFKKQYKEFTKVCQGKGARFRSLKTVPNKKKKQPEYEQLEMKGLTGTG